MPAMRPSSTVASTAYSCMTISGSSPAYESRKWLCTRSSPSAGAERTSSWRRRRTVPGPSGASGCHPAGSAASSAGRRPRWAPRCGPARRAHGGWARPRPTRRRCRPGGGRVPSRPRRCRPAARHAGVRTPPPGRRPARSSSSEYRSDRLSTSSGRVDATRRPNPDRRLVPTRSARSASSAAAARRSSAVEGEDRSGARVDRHVDGEPSQHRRPPVGVGGDVLPRHHGHDPTGETVGAG